MDIVRKLIYFFDEARYRDDLLQTFANGVAEGSNSFLDAIKAASLLVSKFGIQTQVQDTLYSEIFVLERRGEIEKAMDLASAVTSAAFAAERKMPHVRSWDPTAGQKESLHYFGIASGRGYIEMEEKIRINSASFDVR